MNKHENLSDLEILAKQTKQLAFQVKFLKYGWIISLMIAIVLVWSLRVNSETKTDSLSLRRLAIVDEKGIERVVIGAPLPDPITLGKRFPRGGKASGILLFDEEGNERSGYITTDGYPNVLFTLDSLARQQTLFMTEPHGSTTFWIWDANNNAFQLNVGGDSPSLKLVKNGKAVYKQPGDEKKEK